MFWTAILLLFLLKAPMQFCMTLLGAKISLSYLVNYKAMKALKVMDLYWIHPVYEIVYLCIQGIFVLLNIISKPKKWSR